MEERWRMDGGRMEDGWRTDGDRKISTLVAMDADSKYGLNSFSTKRDGTTGSTDHTHAGFKLFF